MALFKIKDTPEFKNIAICVKWQSATYDYTQLPFKLKSLKYSLYPEHTKAAPRDKKSFLSIVPCMEYKNYIDIYGLLKG